MLEQINYHLSPIDETIIEFTSADFSSITTKQALHNLLVSKIPTTDTSILDSSSTAFTKASTGIALRYGQNRVYQPVIKFKNMPIPKSLSLKGTYTQINNRSMFFSISAQRLTDNSFFRLILVVDGSAELLTSPKSSGGVSINNTETYIKDLLLTDTFDVTTYMDNQSNFNSFIGNETRCNICIESSATYVYSTGYTVTAYPFYMNGLKFTF